ncbi:class III lanthionine synthetase LanKC [Streptacidiphilus sp. EB129]|uniref:class III lanthionine synthetase LanKC n=1 Tax=Streptacidiphilus sp. EB129 TaxID=3156262 RepID=UPI0035166126
MRYEAYSYADPVFYDSPVRWGSVEEFPQVAAPLPAGWTAQDRGVWAAAHPDGVRLPLQGWKIHVSACLDNAEEILDVVRAYCLGERISFKYLRGLPMLQVQNAKYAPRGSSGKFCTLYPADDAQLQRCLVDLGDRLQGRQGPYILSDLRWGEGPLYLRYGAFAERWCRTGTGEQVLAFADPEGRLVPDVRAAVFEVPSWAPVPEFLQPVLAARAAGRGRQLPYAVEKALHFSNAGGIYLARDRDSGEQVVLKEARPHAGLDQRGTDAVARLLHERDILARLDGLPSVPGLRAHLTTWEHHFLVQEFIEGQTLNDWLIHEYPLVHPDPDPADVAAYTRRALDILDRVEQGLDAIHARGVVFGDLHPRNLILRPDGTVVFVDFELASPIEEFTRPALGAAGFAAPAGHTGTELDHFALAALRLWLFLPLPQLLMLDPGKADDLADAIEQRFPIPAGCTAQIRERLVPRPTAVRPGLEALGHRRAELTALLAAPQPDWEAIRDSLAAGIGATATPDRTDRLFPGDVAQFTHDGIGLAYGAAGVLYALHTTGAGINPEHVRWLIHAARARPATPGLYTGGHGTAYVLDLLGEQDEALDLLERLALSPVDELGAGLAGGLSGVALTLLHFAAATKDERLLDQALALAHRADAVRADAIRADGIRGDGPSGPAAAKVGLMHGASGTALAFLRLYEHTGEPGLLDRAEAALRRDLDQCVTHADGTVQVHDGARVLPYLESGSAGIGLVLENLLVHRPDSALASRQEAVRRAAEPEFIVQPGLFNGRAGLLGYLRLLRRGGPDTARVLAVADRHRRLLAWHQVSYHGHLAFPGDQLLRLSTDLATGSAGVLLALGTALADTPFLPWSTAAPATTAPARTTRGRPARESSTVASGGCAAVG